MKRGKEWVYGTEAAPNSRGAEAAGIRRSGAGDGSALNLLLSRQNSPPAVLYIADVAFSERATDPASSPSSGGRRSSSSTRGSGTP